MSDDITEQLEKLGIKLYTIKFSEEEQQRIKAWREMHEENAQELWCIYHWIVQAQDGRTNGIYRLREWLEKYNVPDNTNGEFEAGGYPEWKEE